MNLNASVAAQVEVELSRVSDADVDCRSCRYVTTLALLDTQTSRLNQRQYLTFYKIKATPHMIDC